MCTLINTASARVCAVCDSARPPPTFLTRVPPPSEPEPRPEQDIVVQPTPQLREDVKHTEATLEPAEDPLPASWEEEEEEEVEKEEVRAEQKDATTAAPPQASAAAKYVPPKPRDSPMPEAAKLGPAKYVPPHLRPKPTLSDPPEMAAVVDPVATAEEEEHHFGSVSFPTPSWTGQQTHNPFDLLVS